MELFRLCLVCQATMIFSDLRICGVCSRAIQTMSLKNTTTSEKSNFLFYWEAPTSELILRLKGGRYPAETLWLGKALGLKFQSNVQNMNGGLPSIVAEITKKGGPLVVSAPPSGGLDGKRETKRLDHAALLATGVSLVTGGVFVKNAFFSKFQSGFQKDKGAFERRERQFNLGGGWGPSFGQTILTVDDVITSGATMAAMRLAVRKEWGSAIQVIPLCLAFTPKLEHPPKCL